MRSCLIAVAIIVTLFAATIGVFWGIMRVAVRFGPEVDDSRVSLERTAMVDGEPAYRPYGRSRTGHYVSFIYRVNADFFAGRGFFGEDRYSPPSEGREGSITVRVCVNPDRPVEYKTLSSQETQCGDLDLLGEDQIEPARRANADEVRRFRDFEARVGPFAP